MLKDDFGETLQFGNTVLVMYYGTMVKAVITGINTHSITEDDETTLVSNVNLRGDVRDKERNFMLTAWEKFIKMPNDSYSPTGDCILINSYKLR